MTGFPFKPFVFICVHLRTVLFSYNEKVKNSGHGFQGLGGFVYEAVFSTTSPANGRVLLLRKEESVFLLYAIFCFCFSLWNSVLLRGTWW